MPTSTRKNVNDQVPDGANEKGQDIQVEKNMGGEVVQNEELVGRENENGGCQAGAKKGNGKPRFDIVWGDDQAGHAV